MAIKKAVMDVKAVRANVIKAQFASPADFSAKQEARTRANSQTIFECRRNRVSDYNTMVNAMKAVS